MPLSLASLILTLAFILPTTVEDRSLQDATPEDAGMNPEKVRQAVELFRDVVDKDHLRGAVLLVARHGKVVLHEAFGTTDPQKSKPMRRDSLFHMASNTKPVVATAILMLAEAGELSLDDPVSAHLPSFDNEKSGGIRIRHLLNHTSGFRIGTLFLNPLMEPSDEHPDAPNLQLEVDRFGEHGPEVAPGTSYAYSNPGYNTLGAIIEVITDSNLEDALTDMIYTPLGMKDSSHHVVEGKADRIGCVFVPRGSSWQVRWHPGDPLAAPFVRASGGMISTAWDYAIFLQTWMNSGSYQGVQILEPESIALATSHQTKSVYSAAEIQSRRNFYGYGWLTQKDESYGHGGSDGTDAWVDPTRDLFGIVFTQSPGGENPKAGFRRLIEESCEPAR